MKQFYWLLVALLLGGGGFGSAAEYRYQFEFKIMQGETHNLEQSLRVFEEGRAVEGALLDSQDLEIQEDGNGVVVSG